MTREELRVLLAETVEAETWEPCPPLEDSLKLREELKLDSVDVVSVLLAVQQRLSINIESHELAGVQTVNDLLSLVEQKVSAKGGGAVQARAA